LKFIPISSHTLPAMMQATHLFFNISYIYFIFIIAPTDFLIV